MLNQECGLRLYSLGIVVSDKERGSDWIVVSPVEHLTLDNGPISDSTKAYDVSGVNHKGVSQKDTLEGDNTLRAKWIPFGHSNRITAPDVIKNETVIIFTYGDTNEYYWTTIFREVGIRRLETVCYMFGNLPSGLTAFDKDSSYWLEVSTHDQYLHLHTSRSNGEPYEYDIRLDTGNGNLVVTDNNGNDIRLDSPSNTLTINTNQAVNVNTENATVTCQEATIDSPQTNITGNVTIGGTINTGANGPGQGTATIAGNVNMVGNISVQGSITATGRVDGSNID